MMFVRIMFGLLAVGLLSSCDFRKEKNTAPKPPPAPQPKPKIIKPREPKKEEVKKEIEPRIIEWEGGETPLGQTFKDADLVFVLFYADWCEHCKTFSTLLEGVSLREKPRLRVLRVNADLFPEMAQKYTLTAVPKVLIFRKGNQVGEFVGSISEDKLNRIIENVSMEGETPVQPFAGGR